MEDLITVGNDANAEQIAMKTYRLLAKMLVRALNLYRHRPVCNKYVVVFKMKPITQTP
jgi:hypothetical protein